MTSIAKTYKQKLTDQIDKCFYLPANKENDDVTVARNQLRNLAMGSIGLLLPGDQSTANEHAARQMALALTHLEQAKDALIKALIFNAQK